MPQRLPTRLDATKPDQLEGRFREVRAASIELCKPLQTEDFVVQSMPDVSPAKWHLAHVTWFFETFLLKPQLKQYRPAQPEFEYLFNSYYNGVGEQFPRPHRGLLTRPTVEQVYRYRELVDEQVTRLLADPARLSDEILDIVELGLHHEQQHQELLLMDIKHVFSCNPLYPAYLPRDAWPRDASAAKLEWIDHPSGLSWIGTDEPRFSFDNERPRHQQLIPEFRIASRLVTNGEFLEFMQAGGYSNPELWLADGWTKVRSDGWRAPLYWVERDGSWFEFSLGGLRPLDLNTPVSHVSYFEASAYAMWADARLPTEAEWETAAGVHPIEGNFVENGTLHPRPCSSRNPGCRQIFGDLWEWTQSSYAPYPGFRPATGALGEYNGKFMCNQYVLRGGSCVTPQTHMRATYRNFFYPHCRWQFSGIRLAR